MQREYRYEWNVLIWNEDDQVFILLVLGIRFFNGEDTFDCLFHQVDVAACVDCNEPELKSQPEH